MNKKLYMIVEFKTGELIEVHQIIEDKNEKFEADNVIYNSLTEFLSTVLITIHQWWTLL